MVALIAATGALSSVWTFIGLGILADLLDIRPVGYTIKAQSLNPGFKLFTTLCTIADVL
ncbi:MAG: hypothetical protein IIB21_06305 [Chloroflexi bacterium]|nr:hypothetical protein [Chloroflexota bacterium]